MDYRPGTASHRRLEDEFYRIMGKFNNRQWGEFARKRTGLNLPEYQIDDIRSDYNHDVREQKYQMLSLWQRRNGKRATAELLDRLVENFLHPPRLQSDSIAQLNPAPVTFDVANIRQGYDTSDTIREQSQQQPSTQTNGLLHSQGRSPTDLIIPANQHSEHRSEAVQNGNNRSAESAAPTLQQNGPDSLSSHCIHNDNSIPNRACSSHRSNDLSGHYSSSSTATFPHNDVADAIGYRELVTAPKSVRSTPVASYQSHSSGRNKAVPFVRPFMPDPIGGFSNIKINVYGEKAIGVQTNYYFGGKKVQKKSRPRETSQQLAEYCSGVKEVSVVLSREDFYEEHLERLELIYKVTHKQKGAVLIINNSFRGKPDERLGSDKDVDNMKALWEHMGCKSFVKEDVGGSDCLDILKKFAGSRLAYDSDFVVIVIMSHGAREKGEDVFYGADGKPVVVHDVVDIFNNVNARRLQGIPKLFFFQFCRGNDVDMGTENPSRREPQDAETLFNSLENTIGQITGVGHGSDSTDAQGIPTSRKPTMSDVMLSFATQQGFRAFRNSEGGSWFINAIVNIFMRHAHDQHLVELMTMVNNAVSSKTAINEDDRTVHEGKEMSDFRSMLRKKLFFFPGFPQENDDADFF